jgi:glyoxylase-like metal-dependent hydrolase (beta-lactamase superfamily II)
MTEALLLCPYPVTRLVIRHIYIIKSKNNRYICSGDATFDNTTLQDGIPFVIFNSKTAEDSVSKLQGYTLSPDVVVLCSHGPSAPDILKTNG